MERYFAVHITNFDDLSYEAALLYDLMLHNSATLKETRWVNNVCYIRFANHIINKYFNWSKFKIKSLLDELEEADYITVLTTKKNIESARYVHFNKKFKKHESENFYFWYSLLDDYTLDASAYLSFMIFEYNTYGTVTKKFECTDEHITADWSDAQCTRVLNELYHKGLIDSEFNITSEFEDLAVEHSFID